MSVLSRDSSVSQWRHTGLFQSYSRWVNQFAGLSSAGPLPLGWGYDNPAFRQFFATLFLPEGTPEQMAWFRDLQRVSTSAANAVRLWLASADIDVRDLAPMVQAPTLVLHAAGDAVVPFEQGRMLAGRIPGARFVPLESRNHILLDWEPAWPRFLAEVREFLAEADPPGPALYRRRSGSFEISQRI